MDAELSIQRTGEFEKECSRADQIRLRDQDELVRFKSDVNLEKLAIQFGYKKDESESTARGAIFRREADRAKLSIIQGRNGQWLFYDFRTEQSGSVLDFVQRETGEGLGAVRKQLRSFLGTGNPKDSKSQQAIPSQTSPSVEPSMPVIQDSEPDREKVMAVWNAATWIAEHPYLLQRHIPRSTLNDSRFRDCWRMDKRGNAVFLHYDLQGPCGYELRNLDFKVMGSRTHKGLWLSSNVKTCLRIVITESPINALSFHALHVDASDAAWPLGYASFGGGMGQRQKPLLGALMHRAHDRGAEVIIGTDNDPAGEEYAETLRSLSPVALERILPVSGDFNEDLEWCVRENGGEQ